jgi:hypothetical protein
MSIEEAIRKKLIANNDLKAKIGERIYILKLPQNPTFPAVVYFKVSNPRHHDIDVAYPRFQFSIFAEKYSEAKEISDLIRGLLQREKGVFYGMPVIQGVYLNEVDFYENDSELYHIASDYKIIYR